MNKGVTNKKPAETSYRDLAGYSDTLFLQQQLVFQRITENIQTFTPVILYISYGENI
ncbi:MAG: hypothetical protein PHS84_11525 [Paludibacter sp.]|nr:hypothetical protein [Paludibacter sp.]